MATLSLWIPLKNLGGEDTGPIPKPFILIALSGYTSMDVVSILRKSKKEVTNLYIKVDGKLSKEIPLEYISIHIEYLFEGKPEYEKDALSTVQLSQEKYCGVSSMLKKIMPVTWDILYNGELKFSNKQT